MSSHLGIVRIELWLVRDVSSIELVGDLVGNIGANDG